MHITLQVMIIIRLWIQLKWAAAANKTTSTQEIWVCNPTQTPWKIIIKTQVWIIRRVKKWELGSINNKLYWWIRPIINMREGGIRRRRATTTKPSKAAPLSTIKTTPSPNNPLAMASIITICKFHNSWIKAVYQVFNKIWFHLLMRPQTSQYKDIIIKGMIILIAIGIISIRLCQQDIRWSILRVRI